MRVNSGTVPTACCPSANRQTERQKNRRRNVKTETKQIDRQKKINKHRDGELEISNNQFYFSLLSFLHIVGRHSASKPRTVPGYKKNTIIQCYLVSNQRRIIDLEPFRNIFILYVVFNLLRITSIPPTRTPSFLWLTPAIFDMFRFTDILL